MSQLDAFVANSFTATVSKKHVNGTTTQICTTSLEGAPGDNRAAFHLDEVLTQCGAQLQDGAAYVIEVAQDTDSMGTVTFTYRPASSTKYR